MPHDKTSLPLSQTDITNCIYDGLILLTKEAYGNAKAAGWYTNIHTGEPIVHNFGERIALIHSEVSEALEAYRKDILDDKLPGTPRTGVEVELADAIIRIFDLAGSMNLDVAGAVVAVMENNKRRADHKREARLAAGGKKF